MLVIMGNQMNMYYTTEYTIQMKNPNSSNYKSDKFCIFKRPFMWINILWIRCSSSII